jgi:spore germination protein
LTATQLVYESTLAFVLPTTQAAQTLSFATETATPPGDFFATATPGLIVPGADCIHEVRAGENLFRLSMYYGIPVNDIVTRNGIVNANIISIGQRLTISGCGTTGALPPATSFPTPTISFGTGGTDLGNPNPGTGGVPTTGCIAQYTVNQYDTLFQISLQYGVAAQSIANANGIANINIIDMGEVLFIPAQ